VSTKDKPPRRENGPADPEHTMAKAVEVWIESQSDWLGDEEGVMVASLRRFAATCDEHPHLVTAHRETAVLTKQLLARKPKPEEEDTSALAGILTRVEGLRAAG
jgi:hypothetical protein